MTNYIFINTETPERKFLNFYKKKNYKFICINLNSIIFCKKNKLKFFLLESFFNKNDKKKIILLRSKIWKNIFFNKEKNIDIVKKIISLDYYSLHYFLDSILSGYLLAQKKKFKNIRKIIYYGENFNNTNYFEFYSKKQNLILLKSFFNNCNRDIKIRYVITKSVEKKSIKIINNIKKIIIKTMKKIFFFNYKKKILKIY